MRLVPHECSRAYQCFQSCDRRSINGLGQSERRRTELIQAKCISVVLRASLVEHAAHCESCEKKGKDVWSFILPSTRRVERDDDPREESVSGTGRSKPSSVLKEAIA